MTEKSNVKADWNDDNRRYFINAMVWEIEQGTFADKACEDDSGKSIPSLAGQKHSRGDIIFCRPTDDVSKKQSKSADEDKPAPSTASAQKKIERKARRVHEQVFRSNSSESEKVDRHAQ